MTITVEPLSEYICILNVSGRLDHTQSDDLETKLQSAIEDGYFQLLIDMTAVTYINSLGLRCLVSGWRQVGYRDGQLILCGLDRRIQEVFNTVGFDKVFDTYATRTEALNHFANS